MAITTANYGFPTPDENSSFDINKVNEAFIMVDSSLHAQSNANSAMVSTVSQVNAIKIAYDNAVREDTSVGLASKIQEVIFTSTVDNCSHIVFGLNYVALTDTITITDCYYGSPLTSDNFNFNVDGVSIDLTNWVINTGEKISFMLIKNTH